MGWLDSLSALGVGREGVLKPHSVHLAGSEAIELLLLNAFIDLNKSNANHTSVSELFSSADSASIKKERASFSKLTISNYSVIFSEKDLLVTFGACEMSHHAKNNSHASEAVRNNDLKVSHKS